ncbi:MFS transporter [Snodgrassella alvi]|jgi:MFS transporter, YNFM family, putative membrane transport protein|uniref:MFS transporter n=1 Tax=Snodgrassella alvi TaxID=1196083 RepID=A0A855FLJ7_9NEIS|nr:MFS transporter [Snodgrassella alvi]PIT59203.1 MFS transporter [Snodgrassella alvi]
MSNSSIASIQIRLNLALIITVLITGALAFVQVYSVQSILPVLMQEFQASAATIGSTVGATILAVAFMSPLLGMISDALGRKAFIVGSIIFITIPTLALSFVHNISLLWWLRFMQGLAVPGITVVLLAYIGEEFAGNARIRLMGFYVSGTVLGGFLGRFLMGYLTEFMGWRHAFMVMGIISAFGAFLVWRNLPASQKFEAKPQVSTALVTLWHHLHNRYILATCALGFCVLFSLVGCFTYINLYLDQPPYNLSSAQLANIFAVYLIGMVITPLSARLIVKFGTNFTVLIAMSLSIIGVLLTLLHPLWLIVLALAIMSSGIFITQSSTITYISANVTEGRSLASGLYYMCYYAGGFAGSVLCGHAFENGGWFMTAVTLISAQLMAMLIGGVLMRKEMNCNN